MPLLLRERQAQVETPVVLVFAVVAGILVLLVVGWFVLRQQGIEESGLANEKLRSLANALETAGSSPGIERNVTFGGTVRFACDETGSALWYGEDERYPLGGTIVFGDASVSDIATLRSYPMGEAYRVGNVVTMTGIGGSTGSVIVNPSTVIGAGTVVFEDGSTPYFSPALLEGGNATGSRSGYLCGLEQTMRRYRFVNAVQRERMERLVRSYTLDGSPCRHLYSDEPFAAIDAALDAGGVTKRAADLTLDDAEAIVRAEGQIRNMNEYLIRSSCVTVS